MSELRDFMYAIHWNIITFDLEQFVIMLIIRRQSITTITLAPILQFNKSFFIVGTIHQGSPLICRYPLCCPSKTFALKYILCNTCFTSTSFLIHPILDKLVSILFMINTQESLSNFFTFNVSINNLFNFSITHLW